VITKEAFNMLKACFRNSSLMFDHFGIVIDNEKAYELYRQWYRLKRLNKNHKHLARIEYAYLVAKKQISLLDPKGDKEVG